MADFSVPSGKVARMHAGLWLKTMYLFFKTTAGLAAKELADPTPYLQANGFVRSSSYGTRWGMLKSELWHKQPRSINLDHVTDTHEVFDASGVPIGGANATVASGATNRFGKICAVNANARFV
jgi:hypothetical protein